MSYQAVLFDLDGTIADTALDLAGALNIMLGEDGKPPLPYEQLRPLASHGAAALLNAGYEVGNTHPDYPAMRERYLDTYLGCLSDKTVLFHGIEAVLNFLERHEITWGIVTNKPEFLTTPLLRDLNLLTRAACVVSGDTCAKAKPHPEPMLHACDIINTSPLDCVYVGDAERDIQAGKAVGCATVAALYGYIESHDDPSQWHADFQITDANELIDIICKSNGLP